VAAAGRTDRGVHALGQVASLTSTLEIKPALLKHGLNSLLPRDIYVARVEEAPAGFHARFSAIARVYRYRISLKAGPIRRRYAWVVRRSPEVSRLTEACQPLLGRHEFDAFTARDGLDSDTTCEIQEISWRRERHLMTLDVKADRFLYHMVRTIVGSLFAWHREGRLGPEAVTRYLREKDRNTVYRPAPAEGLFFVRAFYPEDGQIAPERLEAPRSPLES
jgi:tRNA pseudouridine38-40 synthase